VPNPPRRLYGDTAAYERKLVRVMERLGAADLRYDFGRFEAWIEFRYKGQAYRFEHDVRRAEARGLNVRFGSDCFVQLVLSLEDLARMAERGIYDLSRWIAGMKALPAGSALPACLRVLRFDRMPATAEEVRRRFAELVRSAHPDVAPAAEAAAERIAVLQRARDEALALLNRDGGEAS
jgi:hypothetical protein